MSDKIFVGKVTEKQTKFGNLIKIGLNEKDLQKLEDNLSQTGWVNLALKPSKKGGFYLEIDTYGQAPAPAAPSGCAVNAHEDEDNDNGKGDLPF
jgi:hypothetical protein